MTRWLTHPDWAPALLGGWCVIALLAALATWRARRSMRRLGASTLAAGGARDAALVGALLGLVLAWLGPRLGTRLVEVPGHGIDVVVLLDVSRSMDATDTPPSRLVRAREAASDLLLALGSGDRAALAVFAGHGALLTPLTSDTAALVEMLPALDSELMSDRGSHFARGVAAALGAFEPASLRPGVVIAFGDGERAHLISEAELTAVESAGLRIVAGAIGSDTGTVLASANGPLRDPTGATVITRRETRGFERYAEATGGAVVLADAWGVLEPGALLAAARRGLRPGPGGAVQREVPVTHTALPAALAFALLLAELLAHDPLARAARARLGLGRARLAALAALAALGLGAASTSHLVALEEHVRRRPDDARALVALGVARAEAGDPVEAARAFAAAAVRARAPEGVALASYDLGVALLEAGDYAGARDAFFDAVALASDDGMAKFNLEWSLRALAAEPPPPQETSEPSGEPPPESEDSEREAEAPEPAPVPEAEPAREPEPAEASASLPQHTELTPEDVARWLDAVEDQPLPAFRAKLEEGPSARSGPQW
jgi:Ca-activated chloride channel family protein